MKIIHKQNKNQQKGTKYQQKIIVPIKKEQSLLEKIFPQVCAFCGKLDQNALCNKCKNSLNNLAIFQIEDYTTTSSFFDEYMYIFKYEGIIRKVLLDYKFEEKSYINETFVNFLKNNEKICAQIQKYDIIMPIPISKERFKQRGYNQSALIAKKIAKLLKVKYLENVLVKIKNNEPQSTLSQNYRKSNVLDVYNIKNKNKIAGKKVLLVDDIFTTGSTVNECSKIIKNAGTKRIGIFTIARD